MMKFNKLPENWEETLQESDSIRKANIRGIPEGERRQQST